MDRFSSGHTRTLTYPSHLPQYKCEYLTPNKDAPNPNPHSKQAPLPSHLPASALVIPSISKSILCDSGTVRQHRLAPDLLPQLTHLRCTASMSIFIVWH